jgi:hypothetical protein
MSLRLHTDQLRLAMAMTPLQLTRKRPVPTCDIRRRLHMLRLRTHTRARRAIHRLALLPLLLLRRAIHARRMRPLRNRRLRLRWIIAVLFCNANGRETLILLHGRWVVRLRRVWAR